MDAKLKDILDALPKLSSAELAMVRNGIYALAQFGPKPDSVIELEPTKDESWILDCIARTLSELGVEYCTREILRKSMGAPFREKVPALMLYLQQVGKTKVMQQAALLLGIRLLYNNLREIGLPTTGQLVMRHIHRIPAVINREFPYYAESGLLEMIIRKEEF